MRYWTFSVCDDFTKPETGTGWIIAPPPEEALALVNHPDAQVHEIPNDSGFPDTQGNRILWTPPRGGPQS